MNLIYKTSRQALTAVKNDCIEQAENKMAISYKTSYCKKLKADKTKWLIDTRPGSTRCVCGETGCERATLFLHGYQFTSAYGYCDSCGSQSPMP